MEITVSQDNEVFMTKGMTADIQLAIDSVISHKISVSTLILSDDGVIGVKIVNQDNIVHFVPVEILDDEQDGIWVTGIPKNAKIITLGHHFVKIGDKIFQRVMV